jgi:hypothetical protein
MGNLGNFEENAMEMGCGGNFLSFDASSIPSPSTFTQQQPSTFTDRQPSTFAENTPTANVGSTFLDRTTYTPQQFTKRQPTVATRFRDVVAVPTFSETTVVSPLLTAANVNASTNNTSGGGTVGGGGSTASASAPTKSGMSNTKKALVIGGSLLAIVIGLKALKVF